MEIQQKVTKSKWEQEFTDGQWNSLETSPLERARHAVIGMYLNFFSPAGRILDVGSGLGTTTDFLNHVQKSNYIGIDISERAVREARSLKQAEFEVIEFLKFQDNKKYDVIIFNEVLYYLDEKASLCHALELLKDDGLIIVSLYRQERMHYNDKSIWDLCYRYFVSLERVELNGVVGDGRRITWRIETLRKKSSYDKSLPEDNKKQQGISKMMNKARYIVKRFLAKLIN